MSSLFDRRHQLYRVPYDGVVSTNLAAEEATLVGAGNATAGILSPEATIRISNLESGNIFA